MAMTYVVVSRCDLLNNRTRWDGGLAFDKAPCVCASPYAKEGVAIYIVSKYDRGCGDDSCLSLPGAMMVACASLKIGVHIRPTLLGEPTKSHAP